VATRIPSKRAPVFHRVYIKVAFLTGLEHPVVALHSILIQTGPINFMINIIVLAPSDHNRVVAGALALADAIKHLLVLSHVSPGLEKHNSRLVSASGSRHG
jgi:hypothetical protein